MMQLFEANYDRTSLVTTVFPEVLPAKCLRLIPLSFHSVRCALRLQVLGCGKFTPYL